MKNHSSTGHSISLFAILLDRYSRTILIAALAITFLLALPVILVDPPTAASQEPTGEVFDVRDRINNIFASPVHPIGVIVEARSGDVLTKPALLELLLNQNRLIAADKRGELAVGELETQPYLYTYYDPERGQQVPGVSSLADAVDDVLRQHPLLSTTLSEATEEQVKLAVHTLFSNPATSDLKNAVSVKATSEPRTVLGREIVWWEAPALIFNVLADNEKLGGGSFAVIVSDDETIIQKEQFNRKAQEILRGDQSSYQLWGMAIDINLESAEEGQQAGVFITLTAIVALVIVGLTLRSYWAVAFTGVGLAALIVWLKGISTLVGIKGGLVNDLIVPIAMISLGVDFAVHAVRRYKEERDLGHEPRTALTVGMTGVAGALLLAFASDSIAFLSNTSSGIEAVIHFGLAASVAVGSAFVVLGLVVPLAVARADENTVDLNISDRSNRFLKIFAGLGVSVGAGSAIIIMIAVSPLIGLAVLVIVALVHLLIPYLVGRRQIENRSVSKTNRDPVHSSETRGLVERMVEFVVEHRYPVLLATSVITAVAMSLAVSLDSTFDANDLISSDSDFVISLDKLDEHVGERGGEPASILIEGDFSDPATIEAVSDVHMNLQVNEHLAHDTDGELRLFPPGLLEIIRSNTESPVGRERMQALSGIDLSGVKNGGFPGTSEEIRTALELSLAEGVYNSKGDVVFNPERVATRYRRIDNTDFTIITVALPGTREQSKVKEAFDQLEADLSPLETAPGITSYGLTGSPFTRNEGLKATTSSLQRSIPIAAISALTVLILAMRSFRFAVATVIPIGLVVVWLYATMYIAGFKLNFVTATIGAVSIGVGIDYSIHMTERFREELKRSVSSTEAARKAARGTGAALTGSAASSIGGFAVMGFAPMPMFASYGLLTAIMIALALIASLLVLPALLTFATKVEKVTEK